MELAMHNFQEEHADINNLWCWPAEKDEAARSNLGIFVPPFMKWVTASPPYINIGLGPVAFEDRCRFGKDFVQSHNNLLANYSAGVFLDLQPGSYVIEYDSDWPHTFFVHSYARVDKEKVQANKQLHRTDVQAGHATMQFTVSENEVVLINFRPDGQDAWQTITNVKIREGVI